MEFIAHPFQSETILKMKLLVAPGILDQLVRHARSCLPEEACGFLVGRDGLVARFVPSENILKSKTAYSVAPEFLFELFRQLRNSGEELLAVYHSHPNSAAVLSTKDILEAHYPDSAQVVVSLQNKQQPEVRAYRVVAGKVSDVELHAIV